MVNLIISFISFVKNPNYKISENKKLKINHLLQLFIFILVLNIFLSFLTKGVFKFLNFPIYHNHFSFLLEAKKNYYYLFFKIVLVSPVLEELLFRSILKPQKKFISLFLFSLVIIIFNKVFMSSLLVSSAISAAVVIPISFYLFKFELDKNLLNWYYKNYKIIVYSSSILFGFIHVINYRLTLSVLVLSPLYILPQIIAGFAYAFIRIRFGLFLSIFSHSVYNFFTFIMLILITMLL